MNVLLRARTRQVILVSMAGLLVLFNSTGFIPLVAADLARPFLQTGPAKPPSGVGRIELEENRQVVLMSSGIVAEVGVELGDQVKAGDLLVSLDTQQLEWAVQAAEMNLESAQIGLAQLNETVDEVDIALAEANYLLAQENLAVVEAGPTAEQLNAATNNASAALAAYNELKAGPTQARLTQDQASLRQAEIALQEAQRAYDQIAWMPEAGTRPESAALQQATISYESAKAAYEETTEPAKPSALQSALANAQGAQDALNELKKKPTSAELASARANLAEAEANLTKIKKGPNENALRLAEIGVEQALIGLEQARIDLENAQVMAPIAGTVLAVNVEPGEQAGAGTVVVTLADTSQLKLVVNVEQREIPLIGIGEEAAVSVYALPDRAFTGKIDLIVPVSDASTGLVTYPVTLHFTDDDLSGLLPGMTATARFGTADSMPTNSTLPAPTKAAPTAAPTLAASEEMTVTAEATVAPSEEVTTTTEITPTK